MGEGDLNACAELFDSTSIVDVDDMLESLDTDLNEARIRTRSSLEIIDRIADRHNAITELLGNHRPIVDRDIAIDG
jgi:hypothetical protein